jgi:hypothetical protein
MTTTDALRNAALASADGDIPGVMLEIADRLLWVYPVDGTVYWFLDGRAVTEDKAEAFLSGNDVDPRRIADPGGSYA